MLYRSDFLSVSLTYVPQPYGPRRKWTMHVWLWLRRSKVKTAGRGLRSLECQFTVRWVGRSRQGDCGNWSSCRRLRRPAATGNCKWRFRLCRCCCRPMTQPTMTSHHLRMRVTAVTETRCCHGTLASVQRCTIWTNHASAHTRAHNKHIMFRLFIRARYAAEGGRVYSGIENGTGHEFLPSQQNLSPLPLVPVKKKFLHCWNTSLQRKVT